MISKANWTRLKGKKGVPAHLPWLLRPLLPLLLPRPRLELSLPLLEPPREKRLDP